MARATRYFEHYTGRQPSIKSRADRNLKVAIACALIDRYGEAKATRPLGRAVVSG